MHDHKYFFRTAIAAEAVQQVNHTEPFLHGGPRRLLRVPRANDRRSVLRKDPAEELNFVEVLRVNGVAASHSTTTFSCIEEPR